MLRNFPAATQALSKWELTLPNGWGLDWVRAWTDIWWKGDTTALRNLRTPTGKNADDAFIDSRVGDKIFLRQYAEAERLLLNTTHEFFSSKPPIPKNFLLGRVYFYAGDKVKARDAYQRARAYIEWALAEQPQSAFVQLTVAELMAGIGERDEAMRLCERAMEMLPVSRDALMGRTVLVDSATIYGMLGDADRAVPLIELARSPFLLFCIGRRSVSIRSGTRFALIHDSKNSAKKISCELTQAFRRLRRRQITKFPDIYACARIRFCVLCHSERSRDISIFNLSSKRFDSLTPVRISLRPFPSMSRLPQSLHSRLRFAALGMTITI